MQTKNMRLLKASVLCLSIALLKQTGHAGILDDITDAHPSERRYTNVETLDEAAIKLCSEQVAAIGMDWLLAEQAPLMDQNLVQQRNNFVNLFGLAFAHLQGEITDNSAPYLEEGLTAMASERFGDVKDVGEAEVQRVLGAISKAATFDRGYWHANLLVQKALFECAKIAQKVSKAEAQEQQRLLGWIEYNMHQSGLSQNPLVLGVFKNLSDSLQQGGASAAAPQQQQLQQQQQQQQQRLQQQQVTQPPQVTLSRTPPRHVGRSVIDAANDAQERLTALGAQSAGAVVSQEQMQQAVELAKKIAQMPGRNTEDLQKILTSVETGLEKGAYKKNPAEAVNQYGALKDILQACGIQVSLDAVDDARDDTGRVLTPDPDPDS